MVKILKYKNLIIDHDIYINVFTNGTVSYPTVFTDATVSYLIVSTEDVINTTNNEKVFTELIGVLKKTLRWKYKKDQLLST